ncbi:MAG: NAD(P)-binding domain-containing protein [Deltaproteobacteria bacterium]|nr:NAD(P)-binding domain-containing protein [Deltaproteobacteria bacterium]
MLLNPFSVPADASRIAIIGPGRLGTAFAYKFGRDNKRVIIYYHDVDVCKEINRDHLNPRHLTKDLDRRLGGMDKVPRLSPKVTATNNLEQVVEDNDFIFLSVTMDRLPELLNHIRPILERKTTNTCFISAIKGLTADDITRQLITPSQLIRNNYFPIKDRFDVVTLGGPFFDTDIALGNPVCLTVAGEKKICQIVRKEFLGSNRRELTSLYNFDSVGAEVCGALKNIVANVKGAADRLELGDSLPGTLFSRSGVEVRSLSRLLGGSFQAFQSQAGVGDMYVTLSSDASKNHRYGRYFYELFTGNSLETHRKVLERIDGKPEGPNTILNVHKFLEKRNMYSPIFHCAYKIFNEERSREEIREQILQATQFDRRTREYIGPTSRLLYRLFPNLWYRRHRGLLANP